MPSIRNITKKNPKLHSIEEKMFSQLHNKKRGKDFSINERV